MIKGRIINSLAILFQSSNHEILSIMQFIIAEQSIANLIRILL